MRGQYTIEEQAEQLKEYLGCPCAYYPPSDDCQLMISDFFQARARGKKEGFVPMLVAVDELLLECLEINGEDKTAGQVRQELLSAPLKSGKELLDEWLRGAKEGWAEVDPEFYANWDTQVIGEVAGGEGINRLLSLWDYNGKQTIPIILAQLGAQSGVLSHGDALVVHQHAAGGTLQLLLQSGHDGLLLRKDLCVRHIWFHLQKLLARNKKPSVVRQKDSTIKRIFLLKALSAGIMPAGPCCL